MVGVNNSLVVSLETNIPPNETTTVSNDANLL